MLSQQIAQLKAERQRQAAINDDILLCLFFFHKVAFPPSPLATRVSFVNNFLSVTMLETLMNPYSFSSVYSKVRKLLPKPQSMTTRPAALLNRKIWPAPQLS